MPGTRTTQLPPIRQATLSQILAGNRPAPATSNKKRMDFFNFNHENIAPDDEQSSQVTTCGTAPSLPPILSFLPPQTSSLHQLDPTENEIHGPRYASSVVQHELIRQEQKTAELSILNANIHSRVDVMLDRLERLEEHKAQTERENGQFRSFLQVIIQYPQLREWLASVGPPGQFTPPPESPAPSKEMASSEVATEDRPGRSSVVGEELSNALHQDVEIYDERNTSVLGAESENTETRMTSLAATEPSRDVTPCPGLKRKFSRLSRRKGANYSRRQIHDLGAIMVSETTQMPSMALNDTEIIVFFFRALRRPIVSLRLRARGWGPHKIANVLNEYRDVNPPYLRNTASVMTVTALRRGEKMYGDTWESDTGKDFLKADDTEATKLIRVPNEESATDCDVSELCKSLKKYPEGSEAGIFTQCVKYCQENDVLCPLSRIGDIAVFLEEA
ncbi:uncharacterized protein BDR25DRAFT_366039 [Lindgomyces ingoldianus]|uniref:Uncharacterized protein n=1 Tax=Lindgomyces ingoldianus TaxID=673940 RepID=A0ACB6R0P3_9PLEO|nr:uncharacterized protein BDR25DRAFT_366039 [Lindgomyces ingoldianus]KAF2472829.1 hypothetical protein BDR25DRAFT_366039 [Lindgomyces ingoldianus]